MTLEQIRKKLDKIDNKIVELLAERQAYMPIVGKYKKEHKIPINQPKREKDILLSKKKKSTRVWFKSRNDLRYFYAHLQKLKRYTKKI